jgi:hypothetical protein
MRSQPIRSRWLTVAFLAACSASGTRETLGTHDPGAPRGGSGGKSGTGGTGGTGGSGTSASGGSGGSGAGGSVSVGGIGGLDAGERDAGVCASADVQVTRVVPTVWLVVEASTFWSFTVEGRTAWETSREALLGPQGAVTLLQSELAFGAITHSWAGNFNPNCPVFVISEPALNNLAGITRALPSQFPGDHSWALTASAMEYVLQKIPKVDAGDPTAGEQIVVLVKSGLPAEIGCTGTTNEHTARKLEMARQLVAAGAKIFVMSMKDFGQSQNINPTDEEVARIGNTGYPIFTPQDQAQIPLVLGQFLREQVSCEVVLNGTVTTGSECQGSVKVDGVLVPCNDPNGWRLKNDRTVELVGAACTDLRAKPQANVRADFPCKIFRPVPR